jgi:hypothetical protein
VINLLFPEVLDGTALTIGLKPDLLNVEFTQHAGDEMYHPLMGGG